MNPLRWKREHQVAWVAICLIGAIAGLIFGWFQSPIYRLTKDAVSGPWANSTSIFLWWLQSPSIYWPWPAFGALLAGLAFYTSRLLRAAN